MIGSNPLENVEMDTEDNVRDNVVNEVEFAELLKHSESELHPILLVAYDTGLRKSTIVNLRWSQIDLKNKCIRLGSNNSSTKHRPPAIKMTNRVYQALTSLSRTKSGYVFENPRTKKPWVNIRKKWKRALKAAKMEGTWIHDLRRSFCTNARRRDVPESVCMKLTGHKTRSVFERYNIVNDEDIEEAIHRIESGRERELAQIEGS
jgi:integrase